MDEEKPETDEPGNSDGARQALGVARATNGNSDNKKWAHHTGDGGLYRFVSAGMGEG